MIPTISNECSQFLTESNGRYLVKQLPSAYQGFSKVKVRLGKNKAGFAENFNRAFEDKRPALHQRAIFTHANISLLREDQEGTEPFYIFPIDGYSIMFNPVVTNSSTDYTEYDKLHIDGDIVSDQLRIAYQSGTLSEALRSNCEIIIYGIPYYYALRSSLIEDYTLFFTP